MRKAALNEEPTKRETVKFNRFITVDFVENKSAKIWFFAQCSLLRQIIFSQQNSVAVCSRGSIDSSHVPVPCAGDSSGLIMKEAECPLGLSHPGICSQFNTCSHRASWQDTFPDVNYPSVLRGLNTRSSFVCGTNS